MKKITYCIAGAVFVLAATLLGRLDGGGLDLALLVVLVLMLLVASADLPAKARVRS